MDENKIQLFEDKRIRTAWDEENEEWLFSVVDVVEVLSGTDAPRRYWSDLLDEHMWEITLEGHNYLMFLFFVPLSWKPS
jgi:hypothetical protein